MHPSRLAGVGTPPPFRISMSRPFKAGLRLSLHTQPSEALTMQSPAGQVKADKDDIKSFLDALANAVSLSGLASTEARR